MKIFFTFFPHPLAGMFVKFGREEAKRIVEAPVKTQRAWILEAITQVPKDMAYHVHSPTITQDPISCRS